MDKMAAPDIPGRRARKRAQTLDLLARTAMGLFEAQGYDAVTMEQIAAGADVAKGTLYNHFPTKESVLAHWIHMQLAADLGHLQPEVEQQASFRPAISLLLDASAAWCEAHRAYLSPYLRFRFLSLEAAPPQEEAVQASDMTDVLGLLIALGQRSGELRDDLDAAHLASLFHHLYLGALMRWLTLPGRTLREEFGVVVTLFVEGSARPPAPRARRRKTP